MWFERLEARGLFAAVAPNNLEQYMIELVNRARANPSAEAAAFGIDLNEGLQPGTISSTPKQPLAVNPNITDAARTHSQWILDQDIFSHTGAGGTNPGQRMTAAGYAFTGSWSWSENIAWIGSSAVLNPTTSTTSMHRNLFVDQGIAGRGHRVSLLNANLRELGIGLMGGVFTTPDPPTNWNAYVATQDFGRNSGNSAGDSFLTGVAYTDAVLDDNFYTPGEGLGAASIQARRISDNAIFGTTTYSSGGYALRLNPGTYEVTSSGPGFPSPLVLSNIIVGTQNVKVDLVPPLDTTPPTILAAGYDFQQGKVFVQFSENISLASLHAGDARIQPLPGGAELLPDSVLYDASTFTATFSFGSLLADGNYTVRLLANSITDPAGNTLAAEYTSASFFILAADANRDRRVDIYDLRLLTTHFGGSGKTFGQGDFNYDTLVDGADLTILSGKWQQTLPATAEPVATSITLATIRKPIRPIELLS